MLELSPTGLKVINTTEVKAPLPRLRVPEPNRWHAEFRDPNGTTLHAIDLAPADELRAEFQGADSIDGHSSRKAVSTFSIRLPNARGTLTLRTDTATLGTVDIL